MGIGHDSPYGATVSLSLGEASEMNLELPDPFTIAVHVVDALGDPVVGAWVSPRWEYNRSASGSGPLGQTDGDGRFSWSGFGPLGAYQLEVSATGLLAGRTTVYEGESGVVYPEETIALYPPSGVEGILTDSAGEILADIRLRLQFNSADGQDWSTTLSTASDGYFLVHQSLPATVGSLWIRDLAPSSLSRGAWSMDDLHLNENQVLDLGVLRLEKSE